MPGWPGLMTCILSFNKSERKNLQLVYQNMRVADAVTYARRAIEPYGVFNCSEEKVPLLHSYLRQYFLVERRISTKTRKLHQLNMSRRTELTLNSNLFTPGIKSSNKTLRNNKTIAPTSVSIRTLDQHCWPDNLQC